MREQDDWYRFFKETIPCKRHDVRPTAFGMKVHCPIEGCEFHAEGLFRPEWNKRMAPTPREETHEVVGYDS